MTTPQGDRVPPPQPQHQPFQDQQFAPPQGAPATAPVGGPAPGYGPPPAPTSQRGFAPQQGFAPPPHGPGPSAPGHPAQTQPAQPQPAQGQAALLQDSVWHGPASYWVSHPLGYATFGAVLGLVLGVVLAVLAPAGGEMTTAGLVTTVAGMPGLAAVAVTVLWIPTMIVSRLLGKAFSGLGDSGGKLLGLLAILLGGGIGFVAFLVAGSTPMWGFILGFFGTMLSMNIGQAIGRGVFFRRPGRVRVGAIVLGVLVVLAAVSWVVSAQG